MTTQGKQNLSKYPKKFKTDYGTLERYVSLKGDTLWAPKKEVKAINRYKKAQKAKKSKGGTW